MSTQATTKPPLAQMALFFAIASTLWMGLHLYVGWRIAEGVGLSPGWLWVAVVLAVASLGMVVGTRARPDRVSVHLRNAAYLYMGAFSIAFFGTVVTHLVAGSWSLFDTTPDWLAPGLVVAVLAVTLGVSVAAAIGGRRPASLVEVEIPIEDLHPDLDGYRVVQLSDVHVGAPATAADLAAAVATANDGDGDLIAFVGDLVDGSVEVLGDEVAALGELSARDGVYFVTGNHEYYSGAKAWERRVTDLGLVVLNNTHERVQVGRATLLVAGVTDVSSHQFVPGERSDPARAVEGGDDADFALLLAHQPKSIHAAERAGVDLQLSGHTHGGQFPPWTWVVPLFVPYNKGLHRHGHSWIYVSCGTGLWGPPMRLGAPAEVTAITLRRA